MEHFYDSWAQADPCDGPCTVLVSVVTNFVLQAPLHGELIDETVGLHSGRAILFVASLRCYCWTSQIIFRRLVLLVRRPRIIELVSIDLFLALDKDQG